ncbi:MAG: DUF1127 domain-containing protein [Pseudomonadota bacterium]
MTVLDLYSAPRWSMSLKTFARALRLQKSRADLRGLSEAQLRDIGVSTEMAQEEAARPIWDVPANWRG